MNHIKSIRIKGFKKFQKLDVDFNEHMNILVGDNEAGKSTILEAIQMGILTESTKERLEQLEEQKKSLKLSITQTQIERPRYTKQQIVDWISRFKYGNVNDPEYQRQIIDIFINAIYVFDDKLAFTYNFHDGTETITLKEIEAAFGSDLSQVAPRKENTSCF